MQAAIDASTRPSLAALPAANPATLPIVADMPPRSAASAISAMNSIPNRHFALQSNEKTFGYGLMRIWKVALHDIIS